MSVLFRKALETHHKSLRNRMNTGDTSVLDKEIVEAKAFLSVTKDEKWKRHLEKRVLQLEARRRKATDNRELQARFNAVDELYQVVKNHPEYNKTRAPRGSRSATKGRRRAG